MSDWETWDFVKWVVCFAIAAVATHVRLHYHGKGKGKFTLMEMSTDAMLELIEWAIGRFLFRVGRDLFATLSIMGLLAWAYYAIFPG